MSINITIIDLNENQTYHFCLPKEQKVYQKIFNSIMNKMHNFYFMWG